MDFVKFYLNKNIIVTGFTKAVPNYTRTEIQFMAEHSNTTQKHQTHGYWWPSLLSQMAFCQPCQTMKVHYRACGAMQRAALIGMCACGVKLLSTTISACPVEWVCFCHLLKTQSVVCIIMEGPDAIMDRRYHLDCRRHFSQQMFTLASY